MRARALDRTALALVSTGFVLFLAVPGLATATSDAGTAAIQPDARTRLQKTASQYFGTEAYNDPWTGDDVYNTSGIGQSIRTRYYTEAPGWDRWVFGVSIQNDGSNSDGMRVQATGTPVRGWTVKYFVGSTNVTTAVRNGTFTTSSIAPGEDYLLKVKFTRYELFDTDPVRQLIAVTSVTNPNRVDAVKLVFKPMTCGC